MSVKRTRWLDDLFIFTQREKRLNDAPYVLFFVLPLLVQKNDKNILSYILIDLRA
jgi:hypothetical protein